MAEQSSSNKKKLLITIGVTFVLLVLVNILFYFFHGQIDLTRDKRYSITPATKNMLKKLDKPVFISVYLDASGLPAPYKKLSNSLEELLKSFREYSDNKIQFRFVDPQSEDSSIQKPIHDFRMSGFPVLVNKGKKGMEQQLAFPWALVVVDGKALPVFLQESSNSLMTLASMGKAEQLLEYNLASAIHLLSKKTLDSIAFLTGNGEPFGREMLSAFATLGGRYVIDTVNLQQTTLIPSKYKTIIINRPMQSFNDEDKLKVDQYVMNGGNLFIAVNAVSGSLDSLRATAQFNALPVNYGFNDLLFNYGVRVNPDLVRDADENVDIPLPSSPDDRNPVMYHWEYYPILHAPKDAPSPIVKNLNEVLGKFVSSIDTIPNGIHKSVLLTTSKYTKLEGAPIPVMLATATQLSNRAEYNKPNRIAAVLLEGSFSSFYAAHLSPALQAFVTNHRIPVREKAPANTKIIVVGDGDLIMNDFSEQSGPRDMGMYPFSDYRFENAVFFQNSIEYLTDPDNLLDARSKNFEPLLLDARRVEAERGKWQVINIVLPIILVIAFGAVYLSVRKKKYG